MAASCSVRAADGLGTWTACNDTSAVDFLDLVLLALMLLAAYSGYRRGAVLQVLTFGGLFLGLLVGALVAPQLARLVSNPTTQAVIALVGFLAFAAAGDVVGWMAGARVWQATRRSRLAGVDAAGGSVVAIVALLLATWFIGLNLASGPWPPLSREIRGSAIIRGLDDALPEPPSLLGQVRQFLDKFGFPEVFAGLPPAPGGPVKPPTSQQARKAFRGASGSTLKIVGKACGRIQEGSGFVVADGYVVTNAHVVAGVRSPEVQAQNGGTQPARPVLFDPRLDVAVLRVGSTPPPLQLDDREVGRGARGAVVGYPGGGDLTGVRAASRRVLHAVGRDIYGNGTVVRDIYELQAVVRPGNSGGPFVLVDGEVAGLVFAASTTDPDIGYAITSTEIKGDLDRGIGSRSAVGTGGCTR
jgi:S1-C subfamily serine protease